MFRILLLAIGLGTRFGLHSAPWPEFRGPDHQGVSPEKNLPVSWNATNHIAWKTPIPGESWSTPAVWGDHVFVTATTAGGARGHVLALDARTGAVRWDREVLEQVPRRKEARNSYATPSPATDGRRVYTCFGDGTFVALDFKGNTVWTNRDFPFYSQHGLGTSPILHDGLLIMARDGSSDGEDKKLGWQKPWDRSFVVALDTKTGRTRWKGARGMSRISHGSPVIWRHDGRTEVVSEAGDVVQGFDFRTGERLWTSTVTGEGKVPSTVIGEGLVFTSGGWGGRESVKAFRLGGTGDQGETRLVWEQKKGVPKVPSLVLVGPLLFAVTDGGVATCYRAASGEIVWQERLGGNYSASPVAADGRIYLLGDNGETVVLAASERFEVVSRNPLGGRVQASPAISGGRIFIRTDTDLYAVGR